MAVFDLQTLRVKASRVGILLRLVKVGGDSIVGRHEVECSTARHEVLLGIRLDLH